jgi:Dolichyl-phosphate-mannose-protein mannosyltransferase
MEIRRERAALLFLWALAALGCLLGVAARPSFSYDTGTASQTLDLVRIVCATALALTLLLGPGLLWRAGEGGRRPSLGFLALPGMALLALGGGLAWLLSRSVEPDLSCFMVFGPVLGLLLGGMIGAGPEDLLDPEERFILLVVGCALGFAIARAVWSGGPDGELYRGGISRTLEVGNRSDSRISYIIPQLVQHGTAPYSELGASYFLPYNFSSRGPLAGLASAPVVLLSGGRPPVGLPEKPWLPFDPEGFMAYRAAMMAFAATAFLSLWDLVRRLGGRAAGRFAVLLAATTPFLVHEIWFTWPKLLAASFVLLAGLCIVERRPLSSGLLLGVGYLMHPSALLGLTGLGLIALWPLKDAVWKRPQLKAAVLLVLGTAVSVLAWRLVNGSHFSQEGFTDYLKVAGVEAHPAAIDWLAYRAESALNTLVPFVLPAFFAESVWINAFAEKSPASIHFFFQYWDGLPFGAGILFYPLLLVGLVRAARLWPWAVFATVVVPFLAFTVYWGASQTGMLREGLQAWVLVLLAVVALQQARAGFPWLRSKIVRAILSLRAVELGVVALGPALATNHVLVSGTFTLNDVVALLAMLGFAAALAALVWTRAPAARDSRPG